MSHDPHGLVGRVLDGTYHITRPLAKGGMGAVYEAVHARLAGKRYAVKVLHPVFATDVEVFRRFRREAEIASQLGHQHIVDVQDFNVAADSVAYMVMEFLDGEDLAARIARGPMSLGQVVRIVEQVASALSAAHAAGIVHRDLKPENIFLVKRDGTDHFVKVFDFGISKVQDSSSLITRDQSVMGTPFYMSPEQAKGDVREVDARTDVFALGAIIWEMLTGEMAFASETIPGALYKVVHEHPRPVHDLRPDVGPGLSELLARAMAKDRAERLSSVQQIATELARIAGRTSRPNLDLGVMATAVPARVSEMMPAQPRQASIIERVSRVAPAHRPDTVPPIAHGNTMMPPLARGSGTMPPDGHGTMPLAADGTSHSVGHTMMPAQKAIAPRAIVPTTLSGSNGQTAAPRPPASRLVPWMVAGAAIVLAAGVGFWSVQSGSHENRQLASASQPTIPQRPAGEPQPGSAATSGSAASASEAPKQPLATVLLRFDVQPAAVDATVRIDGNPITGLETMRQRGDQPLHVVIAAKGHKTWANDVVPDRERVISVTLIPKQTTVYTKRTKSPTVIPVAEPVVEAPVEPVHVEPPRVEPPRVEPTRVEPPALAPPHVEPPRVEPTRVEPPALAPPLPPLPPPMPPPMPPPPSAKSKRKGTIFDQ